MLEGTVHKTAFRTTIILLLLVLLLVGGPRGFGQSPATVPRETRKTSTPYRGDLSIFDSPGRDQRLQINRVMDILGIASGKSVADIGAGSGWFTLRAANRIGHSGVAYA